MKVFEKYNIEEDELENRVEESEYWQSVRSFWFDVKYKYFADLTIRQESWLNKIEEDLNK